MALSLARQRQTHMEVVRSRLLVSMLVAHYSMCLTMCLMILDTNISENHIEGSSSERYSWVVSNCKFDLQWVDGCHMTLTRFRWLSPEN